MKDLHYKDSSGTTVHRYQYGYDKAGNRTFARVQQATHEGVAHDNDRSYLYGYDALHRLISADRGELNGTNDALVDAIPTTSTWNLDNLGNWSGGPTNLNSFIKTGDFDGDGVADLDRNIHHDVNNANMIGSLYTDGVETSFIHDICGNLVYDGKRFYQYDAWNRLIQVNLLGYAELDPTDGRITNLNEGIGVDADGNLIGGLGDLVCRYSYDGLGRLIRKETPVNVGETALQRKDYYYDGVRRIEEVIYRPDVIVTPIGSIPADPPPATQPAEPPDVGAFVTGGGVENDELALVRQDGANPLQQIIDPIDITPIEIGETWVDREYVYGPDYVDEFILQVDRKDGRTIYMLQDANYNVMALTACAGHPDGDGGTLADGAMLEQYTYEPYGEIAASESFAPHAVNRVGHQGLFFERFDGSFTTTSLRKKKAGDEGGFYYNRNRFYDPQLGRFIQRDPNATGLPIISALAMNGEALSALLGGFDGQVLYGDGMNLYAYEGGNPLNGRDALGLSLLLGELQGRTWQAGLKTSFWMSSAGAAGMFMSRIMEGANWRNAAQEATCVGVSMFTMGLAGEVFFAVAEMYMARAAVTARGGAGAAAGAAQGARTVKGFERVWNAKHGPALRAQLTKKATSTNGVDQGIFIGPRDAIEQFIASKLPLNHGAVTVAMPAGWGQVILTNGKTIATNFLRIVPSGSGIKTAFPVPY